MNRVKHSLNFSSLEYIRKYTNECIYYSGRMNETERKKEGERKMEEKGLGGV